MIKPIVFLAMAFLVWSLGAARVGQAGTPELRLYVLDCGHASFKDMSLS